MYKHKHQRILVYYLLALGVIGLAIYHFRPTPVPEPALALSVAENADQNLSAPLVSENSSSNVNANKLSQEVQSLVAKRRSEVLKGAEWIHIIELHQRNKETAGSLSTGQQIPINYALETWYHLNGQGKVLQLITFMKNENNETVQVSTYDDGIWQNLTVGEKWQGDPPTLNLDYGFSKEMASAPSWGSTLNREDVKLSNGRSALVFSISDRFDQPIKIEGHENALVSGETRAHFDPQSGALISLDRIFVDENGRQYFAEQMKILTFEKMDLPPQDVLMYLQGATK